MRIVRLVTYPRAYIRQLYERRPALADLDWAEQAHAVFSDFFSMADSWGYWLRRAGIDALDVLCGVPALDAAYRRQFPDAVGSTDPVGAVAAVLRALEPDLLFLSAVENWTPEEIAALRRGAPSVRAVLGMAGVDVYHWPAVRALDAFVTCLKGLAASLREEGVRAFHMPHAFDPRILDRLGPAEKTTDFAFFGNIHPGGQWHDDRRRLLDALAERCGLVAYTAHAATDRRLIAKRLLQTGAYWTGKALIRTPALLDRLPFHYELRRAASWPAPPSFSASHRLERTARAPVYGLEMHRALAATRLTVNLHIGSGGPWAANMRLYESTGVGAGLLTDWKEDLEDYFSPDEAVAFHSREDAVAKATALLKNPARLADLAAAGQARTLRDHTYERRVPTLLEAAAAAMGAV
jgi:spore maturation protein CgeB